VLPPRGLAAEARVEPLVLATNDHDFRHALFS
jgi:hypothetical protein